MIADEMKRQGIADWASMERLVRRAGIEDDEFGAPLRQPHNIDLFGICFGFVPDVRQLTDGCVSYKSIRDIPVFIVDRAGQYRQAQALPRHNDWMSSRIKSVIVVNAYHGIRACFQTESHLTCHSE
ncbi:hypothetical protein FHP25_16590 [Vineibacter terrae]|uniref:Uncharacterized protein n=1 Tax=Vineibacter terrae TaxID=2586908 RepID=A0A5C8PKX1_9HYPH|nr:hypothetical protein [Vineibacter terrae]TXL74391.1 hypothetical protein FHP25_16590 [Vineibacter terrae]